MILDVLNSHVRSYAEANVILGTTRRSKLNQINTADNEAADDEAATTEEQKEQQAQHEIA